MLGRLKDLDTVNFSPERNPAGLLEGQLRATRNAALIYSVFYDVAISPNEVIELALVHRMCDATSINSLPFVLFLDDDCVAHRDRFTKQLIKLLRRSGDDAFVFSTMPAAVRRRDAWAERLAAHRGKLSDRGLLKAASNAELYGEIVEEMARLDSLGLKLPVRPYRSVYHFDDTLGMLLGNGIPLNDALLAGGTLPSTRSAAYKRLSNAITDDAAREREERVLDLATGIQHALNLNAQLVWRTDESSRRPVLQTFARLTIDLKGLLRSSPELEFAMTEMSLQRLSAIRLKAHEQALQGWRQIRDLRLAQRHFTEALRTFVTGILGPQSINLALIRMDAPSPTESAPSIRVDLAAVVQLVRVLWKRFRGFAQFINLR